MGVHRIEHMFDQGGDMHTQQTRQKNELRSTVPAQTEAEDSRSARAALALAVLRKAEHQTGAIPVAPLVRKAAVQNATTQNVTMQNAVTQNVTTQMVQRPAFNVPHQLQSLLPGGLKRGSVAQVTGSTALMLEMLAAASTTELWTAIVGQPHIGILAAAETGVDLQRLILVPNPGPDAALALAALLDGVDILVVGPMAALLPSDRRRLTARARERGTVIIATSPWSGAQVELNVTGVRWRGLGAGTGRLQSRELRVERTGRGNAAQRAIMDVVLPTGPLPDDCALGIQHTAHEKTPNTTQTNPPLRLVG